MEVERSGPSQRLLMGCGQSKTSSKSLNLRKLRLDDDQKQKDDNIVDVSNNSPGIVFLTLYGSSHGGSRTTC